jgi:transposase
LLTGIWVPPDQVRDLRATLAERSKMTRLATQAKNRLHAVLQRHHLTPPEGSPFIPERRDWWLDLPVSALERQRILCDLDTLAFAANQLTRLNQALTDLAADEGRLELLLQLPGISLVTGLTLLGAIGDIRRFPDAKHLVGYAGLGARIHDSGQTTHRGQITKAGRRDLRTAMVEAAQAAANSHPHWQAELARLEPRLGRNKAIVAIARKLLVAVWHVLTEQVADRHAEPESVARKLLQQAYRLGRRRRTGRESTGAYVRRHLDRLRLGRQLTEVRSGKRRIPLPPSTLNEPQEPVLAT